MRRTPIASWCGLTARDVVDEIRQVERILASPPPEAVAALERFDPDRCRHGAARALLRLAGHR